MAEITQYQQQQTAPEAVSPPMNGTRVSPDAEGAAVGEGLQQVGGALGDMQLARKRKADTVAIENAYSAAQKALNDTILNPQTGYLGKKGADAALTPGQPADTKAPIEPYLTQFNQALDNITSSLTNEDQKREVGWRLARLRETGMRTAYEHEREEGNKVGAAIHAGAQDQAVQTAAINAAKPGSTDTELNKPLVDIMTNATIRAKALYGDNASKDAIQSLAGPDLQRAALSAMLAGLDAPGTSPARAQQLFNVYGELLGQHRGAIEKAMQNVQDDDVAKAQGSAIIAAATNKRTGWVDPDKAQQLLTAIPESTSKGDVLGYVQKRLQQSLQMRRDQLNKHVDDVYQQAGDDQGRLDLSLVKPSTKAYMQTYEPEKWNELKRRAAADQVKVDNDEARAALPEERDNFITAQWLMATQPEHFASMTPQEFQSEWRNKLAPKDYRSLGTIWREQLQSAAKEQPHLPPVVLDTALSVGRQAGLFPSGNQPPTKWNNDDAKNAWDSLTSTLISEADQFKRTHGVAPKVEDLSKMAVNHLVGVKIAGGGMFGTDKTTTALQAEQANGGVLPAGSEVVSVPGVPKDDVQRIKAMLTTAGKAISGSAILTVYQRERARQQGAQ